MIRRLLGNVTLTLLILGLVGFLTRQWWLGPAGRLLVVQDPPAKADAIVVLGGAPAGGRVAHAVDLYKKGHAPLLVLSGGVRSGWRTLEAMDMREQAVALGVPARAIVTETESHSTYENARNTRPLLESRRVRAILLVTSDWHSRRAAGTFRKALRGTGIQVISSPEPTSAITEGRWWVEEGPSERILSEVVKLIWYKLKGWL